MSNGLWVIAFYSWNFNTKFSMKMKSELCREYFRVLLMPQKHLIHDLTFFMYLHRWYSYEAYSFEIKSQLLFHFVLGILNVFVSIFQDLWETFQGLYWLDIQAT